MPTSPPQQFGPLFLYSTSPAPHEQQMLRLASRRREPTAATPLRVVVMQTPLETPSESELAALRGHFGTRDIPVAMEDSGLRVRDDAYHPAVVERLASADLILITGGSPGRLCQMTADTPALAALTEASAAGAVLAGCSAGAIVLGAGMLTGRGDQRQPLALWGWLPCLLVAPHYGRYDLRPWLRAFPGCSALGIPDSAMALVQPGGTTVESLGPAPLSIIESDGAPSVVIPPGGQWTPSRRYIPD